MFEETEEQVADTGEETQGGEESQEGAGDTGAGDSSKDDGKTKLTPDQIENAKLQARIAELEKRVSDATPEPYEKLRATQRALAKRAQEQIATFEAQLKAQYPNYTTEQVQMIAQAMAVNETAPVLDKAYETMAGEYQRSLTEERTRDVRLELAKMGVDAQTIDAMGNNTAGLQALRDNLKQGRGETTETGKGKTKVKTMGSGASGGSGGSGSGGGMTQEDAMKRITLISEKIENGKELTKSEEKFRDDFKNNRLQYSG